MILPLGLSWYCWQVASVHLVVDPGLTESHDTVEETDR